VAHNALPDMDSRFGKGKDYLSYSAMRLWLESPDRYRAKYYEERKDIGTVYTRFGKKIAELLEVRDFKNYPALEKVPFYTVSEEPVDVVIGDVPIKGFIDLFEPNEFRFGEVKTGIVHKTNGPPWNMVKVRQHTQLPFYSLILKKKYGKIDPVCHLVWLETFFESTPSISKALRSKGELTVFLFQNERVER